MATIDPSATRPTHTRFAVTAWLAAAAVLAYLCRNSIAVVESTVRADLGLTEEQMGWIMGPVFFWSYALAQIPGGWLGARFGSRRCLPIVSAAGSVSMAVFAWASGFWQLLCGRLCMGLAQAALFPCCVQTFALWHPRTERALASGVLAAAMSVGHALGAAITGWLLIYFSWRWSMTLYALPGLLWLVAFYPWFRDVPAEHPTVNDAELAVITGGAPQDGAAKPLGEMRLDRPVRRAALTWLCVQQFFRAAGLAFFGSWFATYLQETRHVSTVNSGWLTALPLLATMAASTLGGGLSDWVYRRTGRLSLARKGVSTISLLLCAVLVLTTFRVENATLATVVISAGIFCAGFAGPCAYAATMDIGGRRVATVFATMNMVGNFGAGFLPFAVPYLRRFVEARPRISAWFGDNGWNAVLAMFALTYLLAALAWMLVRVDDEPPQELNPRVAQGST